MEVNGVKIPDQVKKNAEKADAEIAKIKEEQQSKANKSVEKQGKKETKQPEEPKISDESQKQKTTPEVKPDNVDYKQKYLSLQGKYNAEMKKVHEERTNFMTISHSLNQLNQQIGELRRENTELRDLLNRAKNNGHEENKVNFDVKKYLSKEDLEFLKNEENLEEGTIEIVGSLVNKIIDSKLPKAEKNPQQERVLDAVEKLEANNQNKFWQELIKAVPDFEQIDKYNVSWAQWLDGKIPYSNKTKREALQKAQANLDYTTVIDLFNDFKATQPKEELELTFDPEEHIEPETTVGDGGGDNMINQPKKKIWTRQEVKQFGADVTRGKISPEEALKINAELNLAFQEGRITE